MRLTASESSKKWLAGRGTRSGRSVALVAILGLTATVAATWAVESWSAERTEFDLRKHSQEYTTLLQHEIDSQVAAVRQVAALFEAFDAEVDRGVFQRFVAPVLAQQAGIQALGWVPRVEGAERQRYERAARADGLAEFRIFGAASDYARPARAPGPAMYPVFYVEPLAGNEAALGFDLASSAERLAALEHARDTGEPQTTRPIRLLQEAEDGVGFLVFVPVYGGGSLPTTVRARRSALIGLGLGVFRVADLIGGVLPVGGPSALGVVLNEHDASGAAPIYTSVPPATIAVARDRVAEVQTLRLPGRQWSVAFWPDDAGQRAYALFGLGVLVSGLLLTALFTGYVLQQAQIRQRAIVGRRQLRQIIDLVPHMLFVKDENNRLLMVNQALADGFGATVDDLLAGTQKAAFSSLEEEKRVRAHDREVIESGRHVLLPEVTFNDHSRGTRLLQITKIPFEEPSLPGRAILGVAVDITELKQAERALSEEKERALVTLHSIGDGVISTDAEGVVTYLNPVAEALTGWTLASAQGKSIEDVFAMVDEVSGESIPSPVRTCLSERRMVDLGESAALVSRDGTVHPIQDSVAPIRSAADRVVGAVAVFSDVTEKRRIGQLVAHQATHDPLTGLVNRLEFERRLGDAIDRAKEYDAEHAMLYIDLDRFKIVNDSAGHIAGDQLLKQAARMIDDTVRSGDTTARLGGDEFGVLLERCSLANAKKRAEALQNAFAAFRFAWGDQRFDIGASIGIVGIDHETENTVQVMGQGDVACYVVKEHGRGGIHLFRGDREMGGHTAERRSAMTLTRALEGDRLRLYCQPIVPLDRTAGESMHYELLLRLVGENDCVLLPGAFIPAAERYGMIGAIDRWVVETALSTYGSSFAATPDARISINLSGSSITDESFLAFIGKQLDRHWMPPENVCFEITETAAITNLSQARRFMARLKDRGCRFALDDVGSGLSSFNHLKALPLDYLKIAGSFVRGMSQDVVDHAMVAAINEVGHIMHLKTVAEWVETEDVMDSLRHLGVDFAQGYAVGPPAWISSSAPRWW